MGFTSLDYQNMLARVQGNRKHPAAKQPGEAPELESKLAEQIESYCAEQWPRWKIIVARRDKKSTIAKGAQDMTIFAPGGKVFCLELKSKTGKRTSEQIVWAKEMEMLGHTVHEVRTFERFKEIICQ